MPSLVVIGLITYQRPKMLSSALTSLIKLHLLDGVSIRVVVVDNDKDHSARPIVESYMTKFSYPMNYFIEKKRGIPFARNRAVEEAIKFGATEIVFFDDDEVVKPDWLCRLYDAYKKYDCDIVTGPVLIKYPEKIPQWVSKGKFFENRRFATGTNRKSAATNNILLSMKWFRNHGLRFDEKLALSGGSDNHLTKIIVQNGGEIKWVDNAIVVESIPQSRLCLKWLLQRKYRTKLMGVKNCIELRGLLLTYIFSSLSLAKNLVIGIFYTLFSLLFGFHYLVRSLIYFTTSFAIIAALIFDHNYEEYETIHGE